MKSILLKILLSCVAVLAPAKAMILTTGVLIFADVITGILAARKRGEAITSAGLRRTIVKCAIYELAIILGFLTQTYLTGDVLPVAKIAAGFIGITEFLSIAENLNTISGNNLLKALIDKLHKP